MSARILIVEDNPVSLELMRYLVQAVGHQAVCAGNGEAALTSARETPPDLVLCDINLPGMDGHAVAAAMRADAALQAVPLVAVTASAMAEEREHMLASGFDGFLSKPIEPANFLAVVHGFLASRQGARTPRPEASRHAAAEILLLDDTPINLELERSLLLSHGYGVHHAYGVDQALKLARSAPPDLIIAEAGMTDDSAFEFLREIRSDLHLCEIPFIFVTSARADAASRALGLRLGANRYLLRPLPAQRLLDEVAMCVAESRGPRPRPPSPAA
jgi:two-component system cell cycle response regulator